MNKRPLIVGNWKMYVSKTDEAKKFAAGLKRKIRGLAVEVSIAPPFTLLPLLATTFKGGSVTVGAQSVSSFTDEKRTGEVSALLAKESGASFAIVGHSERRALGESNDTVQAQVKQAVNAGLKVILCIGETERDQAGSYLTTITSQLSSALEELPQLKPGRFIVAYEPVWAIGKSALEALQPQDLREMSIFIKKTLAQHMERSLALKVPILYGGSVDASNASVLLREGDINGFLVGRASTELQSFVDLLSAVGSKK